MNDNNVLKKYLTKIGIVGGIFSAVIINEQVLLKRLEKQKEKYEAEKEILENKMDSLENKMAFLRDTSFRFYEYLPNGGDFKAFDSINKTSFINKTENIYEKYRPLELNEELIQNVDSIDCDTINHNVLLDREIFLFEEFKKSDSIPMILENGQAFLNSLIDVMKFQNKSLNGGLSRIINNSPEENDREFRARYFMFNVKAKNKMYDSKWALTADYYRTIFIKNVSAYKRTSKYLTGIVDSLSNIYNIERENDSIKFEIDKKQKLDSILNSPIKQKYTSFHNFDFAKFYDTKRSR